jgi:aminopeptidase N
MNKKYLCFLLLLVFQSTSHAQTTFKGIDVQHYSFALTLNDNNDTIKGHAAITIKFLQDVSPVRVNLVKKNSAGKGMLVSSVTENGRSLSFTQDSDVVNIISSPKTNTTHTYTINYQGVPADGLIISTNKFGHRTFFGDNWPNRAHNWLPCADYPSDKASLDFMITAPDHYQVVSNGLKVEEKQLPNHTRFTHWKETVPLPTKVMVIGVADFAIDQSGIVNGIPVYSYVFPENKAVGFKSYAYAPEILAYYINKIGSYEYKKLANVQSKTVYGGMENSSAIFYFENSVGYKGAEELMAHEIAHQWFGDAVTEKSWQNLWLSEGFATYMTNCYLEHKYGIDTLRKREIADRKKVIKFEKERYTPVIDTTVKNNYEQLLNANSYEKGSWFLHMLRRKLGDTLFWKGIRAYYAKEEGINANTADLCKVMEQASGQNLEPFFKQWLYTSGHPDLNVSWNYDAGKKVVNILITQKQNTLFNFPLKYMIGDESHAIVISNKETSIAIPVQVKPKVIKMDPNVDLLAGFEVNEQN